MHEFQANIFRKVETSRYIDALKAEVIDMVIAEEDEELLDLVCKIMAGWQ